jgi:MraZ protein
MAFDAFRGEFGSRMDGKARVSIPAAFRRILDQGITASEPGRTRLVLIYGDPRRKFVAGYSLAGAERLAEQIRALALGSPARRALERHMVVQSVTLEIDEDGRIVLPAAVRAKIGLGAEDGALEVTFTGALDYFELWKKATYDAEMAALDQLDTGLLDEGEDILALLGRAGSGPGQAAGE